LQLTFFASVTGIQTEMFIMLFKKRISACCLFVCFLFGTTAPSGPGPPHSRGF